MTTQQYKCKCCGCLFTARAADRARGWAKFCSKSCKAKKQARTGGLPAHLYRRHQSDMAAYGSSFAAGSDEDMSWGK